MYASIITHTPTGIGAQGGDLEAACLAGLSAGGSKLLLPISRGISKASDPRAAAEEFRVAINAARRKQQEGMQGAAQGQGQQGGALKPYQREFIQFALDSQVLLLGQFTLKSGRVSPYFFNAGAWVLLGQRKERGQQQWAAHQSLPQHSIQPPKTHTPQASSPRAWP